NSDPRARASTRWERCRVELGTATPLVENRDYCYQDAVPFPPLVRPRSWRNTERPAYCGTRRSADPKALKKSASTPLWCSVGSVRIRPPADQARADCQKEFLLQPDPPWIH